MHSGVVYFCGPKCLWSQRIDPAETIFRIDHPWRWLVQAKTLSIFRQLDANKCGYALLQDGICTEQYDPPPE